MRVLGPVVVMTGGNLVAVRGQQGLVLSLLAAAHPRPTSSEALAEELWGEGQPSTWRVGLRVVLNRLRERLWVDAIVHEGGSYRLALADHELDGAVFERLLRQARALPERPSRAASLLVEALELWRGEPFQPFGCAPGLTAATAYLGERRREAEELLVDALLANDQPDIAATWATAFVESEPYRERRWEQLMLALYRTGRQAEALEAARRAATLLRDELGLEPGPGMRRLQSDILAQASELDLAPPRRSGSVRDAVSLGLAGLQAVMRATRPELPRPETSFIGREPELARLVELLDQSRLATVYGPPGVGKTRLATEYAAGTNDHRVIWLDLVPLDEAGIVLELAARTAARSDSGDDLATIVAELRRQPTLLVLDNAEHLAASVARLASDLLDRCPRLRVLVTSRSILGLAREARLMVGPLGTEDALALMIERSGRHPISADERRSMTRLVAELDGLPLPIELVSPALHSSPAGELLGQVTDVLQDHGHTTSEPNRGRHDSLAGAIEWSVNLLGAEDRALFARLGVLSGSYDTNEVSHACQIPMEQCRAGLRRLAAVGLIAAEHGKDGRARWHQLNVIAAESRTQLARCGQLRELEAAYTKSQLALVRQAAKQLAGPSEADAVMTLSRSGDQLRATHLRLLAAGDPQKSADLTLGMWEFTFFRQHFHRYNWLNETLAMAGVDDIDNLDELLAQAALAAWARDRPVESTALAAQAQDVARDRGRPVPLAAIKARLNVAGDEQDMLRTGRLLTQLLVESRNRDDDRHQADNLVVAALGLCWLGMPGHAMRTARRALALAEGTGNPTSVAWAGVGLAAAQIGKDPVASGRSCSAAARLAASVRNKFVQGMAMSSLVTALRRQGRIEPARRFLIEVVGLWGQARGVAQLWRACQEAVLVLAAADDRQGAAAASAELALADRWFPMLSDDRRQLDEITTRVARDSLAESTMGTLPSETAQVAAHLSARLLSVLGG